MTGSPNIENVAVIGSGTMGSGIAQVVACAGLSVTLVDRTQDDLARGRAIIEKSLERIVAKGNMTAAEATNVLGRIRPDVQMDSIRDAQLVIEAVFEDSGVKRGVVQAIDQ